MTKLFARRAQLTLWHVLSIVITLVGVAPFGWMLVASVRQPGLPPPRGLEWWPASVAWENYTRVLELVPLGQYALNSLLVVLVAVPLTLVVASWAGFAIAQLPLNERREWLFWSVALLLVPAAALWVARMVLFNALGVINTFWPLIAPALMGANPLYGLLFYWAFRRVPSEWWEAAQLEGASALEVWWHLALPLARPTVLAVGMLAFVFFWSDFVSPLLFLKTQALYTWPVGVQQLHQLDRTHWPWLMAAAVLMTLPTVGVFLGAQWWLLRPQAD